MGAVNLVHKGPGLDELSQDMSQTICAGRELPTTHTMSPQHTRTQG